MKITPIAPQSGLTQSFHLQNLPLPYSNALRRSLFADVPTMSFDKASFQTYASEIPAEIIAHRIGLIPICCPVDTLHSLAEYYNCPNAQSSQHSLDCQQCTIKARIHIKPSQKYMITDRDIIFERSDFQTFSVRNNSQPIPILLLAENQEVNIELYAFKAPGRVHAKFQPVSAVSLTPAAQISLQPIQHLLDDPQTADFLSEICPKSVFIFKNQKLQFVDSQHCVFCDSCVRTPFNGVQKPVLITPDYTNMTLQIESIGAFSCEEILREGILSIQRKLDEITGNENFKNLLGEGFGDMEEVAGGAVGGDEDGDIL